MYELTNTGDLYQDGVLLGTAGNALLTEQITVADLQAVLAAKFSAVQAYLEAAVAARTLAESRLAELISGARAVLALDETQSRVAAAQALLASVQATELEKKRLALAADIAAKQVELEAL